MEVTKLRRELKKTLKTMNAEGDTAFILLASVFVGARSKAVAELTELPLAEVSKRAKNLKADGIWLKSGKVDVGEWFSDDETIAPLEFGLHCLVADGMIHRTDAA